jgi:5-methylcytosine-specific restriction endonuclease McrA
MLLDNETCPDCGALASIINMPEGHVHHAKKVCNGYCSVGGYPAFKAWIPKPEKTKRRTNTKKLRSRILDQVKCSLCDLPEDINMMPFHVHHRIAVADGGTDDPNNLILLCEECHINVHHRKRRTRYLLSYLQGHKND